MEGRKQKIIIWEHVTEPKDMSFGFKGPISAQHNESTWTSIRYSRSLGQREEPQGSRQLSRFHYKGSGIRKASRKKEKGIRPFKNNLGKYKGME